MANILRTTIVMDFWNFTLSLKEIDKHFLVDWFALPLKLTKRTENYVNQLLPDAQLEYSTMHIIGSYGPNDDNLKGWVKRILPKIPGCKPVFLERQKVKTSFCCTGPEHHEITLCPECGTEMRGFKEKGVDTTISNTLLTEAFANLYDVAVLVSSDRDFIPTAQYLHSAGKKCIHAGFLNNGTELANASWGSINIESFLEDFSRQPK